MRRENCEIEAPESGAEKREPGWLKRTWTRFYTAVKDALLSDSGHWFTLSAIALVLGLLIVTLEAYGVSPLYYQSNLLSYDPAMYKTFGEMMLKGAIPYVDILDIKGPYLFLYAYIAALISPMWGAYILQWWVTSIALLLTFDTARRMGLKGVYRFALVGVFAVFSGIMMEGHNADDSMLELVALSVWALVVSLKSDRRSVKVMAAIADGAAGGILCFTRLTSAAIPFGCAAICLGLLIYRKKYSDAFLYTLLPGLISCLVFLAIPVIYYGAIGCIPQLLEWNFVRPFIYYSSHGYSWERWLCLAFSLVVFAGEQFALIRCRMSVSRDIWIAALGLLIFQTLISLAFYVSMRHMRNALSAYIAITAVPLRYSQEKRQQQRLADSQNQIENASDIETDTTHDRKTRKHRLKRGLIPAVISCGFLPLLLVFSAGFTTYYYTSDGADGYATTKALISLGDTIPEEDRDAGTILGVDIPAGIYQDIGIVPEFLVPCLQSWNESFLPDMEEQVVFYIRVRASWVIVNDRPYEHPEITPIYQRDSMMETLEDYFTYRDDISLEGAFLVYQRTDPSTAVSRGMWMALASRS